MSEVLLNLKKENIRLMGLILYDKITREVENKNEELWLHYVGQLMQLNNEAIKLDVVVVVKTFKLGTITYDQLKLGVPL